MKRKPRQAPEYGGVVPDWILAIGPRRPRPGWTTDVDVDVSVDDSEAGTRYEEQVRAAREWCWGRGLSAAMTLRTHTGPDQFDLERGCIESPWPPVPKRPVLARGEWLRRERGRIAVGGHVVTPAEAAAARAERFTSVPRDAHRGPAASSTSEDHHQQGS